MTHAPYTKALFITAGMTIAASAGSSAVACSIMSPELRPGETVDQAWLRSDRDFQSQLRTESDVIFLARLAGMPDSERWQELEFRTIASVEGRKPPRTVSTNSDPTCRGYDWRIGDIAVIYAVQLGVRDAPLQPWRWGQWAAVHLIPPQGLRDPGMIAALRATSMRLRQSETE